MGRDDWREWCQVLRKTGATGLEPATSGVTGVARANAILHLKARKSLISAEVVQICGLDIHALPRGSWSVPPHPHPIVMSPLWAMSALVLRASFAVGAAGEARLEVFHASDGAAREREAPAKLRKLGEALHVENGARHQRLEDLALESVDASLNGPAPRLSLREA